MLMKRVFVSGMMCLMTTALFCSAGSGRAAFTAPAEEEAGNTPEGYWKTVDDDKGDVRSIVKIWKHTDGKLRGRIEKLLRRPGEIPNPVCENCEGARKNKPVLGMEFLWDFTGSGAVWKEGKVLDPENGKIYNCQLEVLDKGARLKVFGFIRVIFKIGRSQIWLRCTPAEAN